jgi:tRNA-dihydrouridine synthase
LKLGADLIFSESERPVVAQLFGSDPAEMFDCVRYIKELGFDGVDINMGCPDKSVCRNACGAGLIDRPDLAQKIIAAAQHAAEYPDTQGNVRPFSVSVKTRIGSSREIIDDWIPKVLEMQPDALTVHFRTRKEQSLVPAHWTQEVVGKTVDWVKKRFDHKTIIIGNGDVKNPADAREKIQRWNLDGVMIGRGIYGNPWLFSEETATPQQRLEVLLEHHKLYEELLGDVKPIHIMKKHYKAYIIGFEDCKIHRGRLMEATTTAEVEAIINDLISKLNSGALKIRTAVDDFVLPTPDPKLMEQEPDDVLSHSPEVASSL